jgi:hypothetical protein
MKTFSSSPTKRKDQMEGRPSSLQALGSIPFSTEFSSNFSSLASSSSSTIVVDIFSSKRVGFLLGTLTCDLLSPPHQHFPKGKKKNISIGLEGMGGSLLSLNVEKW